MRTSRKAVIWVAVMLAVSLAGGFAAVLKAKEGLPPAAPGIPVAPEPEYSALHRARLDAAWTFGKAGIESCRQYIDLLGRMAARRGINGSLVASIAVKESRCEPLAVSPKKAVGLLQVHLPFWNCTPAKIERGAKCWDFTLPENNPFNAERNAEIATEILADLLAQYDEREALKRYNGNLGKGTAVAVYAESVLSGQ